MKIKITSKIKRKSIHFHFLPKLASACSMCCWQCNSLKRTGSEEELVSEIMFVEKRKVFIRIQELEVSKSENR
jgi:hypothetical protein